MLCETFCIIIPLYPKILVTRCHIKIDDLFINLYFYAGPRSGNLTHLWWSLQTTAAFSTFIFLFIDARQFRRLVTTSSILYKLHSIHMYVYIFFDIICCIRIYLPHFLIQVVSTVHFHIMCQNESIHFTSSEEIECSVGSNNHTENGFGFYLWNGLTRVFDIKAGIRA